MKYTIQVKDDVKWRPRKKYFNYWIMMALTDINKRLFLMQMTFTSTYQKQRLTIKKYLITKFSKTESRLKLIFQMRSAFCLPRKSIFKIIASTWTWTLTFSTSLEMHNYFHQKDMNRINPVRIKFSPVKIELSY